MPTDGPLDAPDDAPEGASDATPDGASSWWQRVHGRLHRNRAMSATTKLVVTLVGTAVLTAGLIMMVTPGPGLVGIAAGLAILATEWDWADRWLTRARRKLREATAAAEAMDPRVRRRRILLALGVVVLLLALVAGYVAIADWPDWSISLWDRAQSFLGFLPDLPGM
ncbi:PGPGW domain-containing protein [Nocardioides pocheonensis]|uniref:TIGR02611 family protein n=1 Tax=Nocardioides pocheonensis TaxID=661485 RepID=A0A3N0GLB6_9ACTN|nr:PGPGW domain-containing protein [Nocardioides pocheonensis]RNM13284.1 TIGR02611 family protein [Nocardioides pocheonensis]